MTAPFFLPSNVLAASTRLRAYEPRFRHSVAKPAPVPSSNGFRARATLGNFPGTLRTDLSRVTWHGRTGSHAFEIVSADVVLTGPVVLVAKHYGADARAQIVAVEAFEAENAARLAAWIARAAVAGIELQVYRAGSRAERAAAVADLSPTVPRACPFVSAGTFDRRAIMAAAVASARLQRTATGAAWPVCLSSSLREVWEVAKAARLAVAHEIETDGGQLSSVRDLPPSRSLPASVGRAKPHSPRPCRRLPTNPDGGERGSRRARRPQPLQAGPEQQARTCVRRAQLQPLRRCA